MLYESDMTSLCIAKEVNDTKCLTTDLYLIVATVIATERSMCLHTDVIAFTIETTIFQYIYRLHIFHQY